MKERERMLKISNISLNNNYAATTRQAEQPVKQEPSLITCKICNKEYNQQTADKLLSKLVHVPNFDYLDTCLSCIQEASQKMKDSYYPELMEARESLNELNILYKNAHNHWNKLSAKYKAYDYQYAQIKHHLTPKPVKPIKTIKAKKDKTPDQIKKEIALKIMSALTPEQQSAILATIAKGA